jgi:GH15 family glucan-1,4-alpha-glucosidase
MDQKRLEMGLIGNGSIAGLVDERGSLQWGCFPQFDGDPVFCALLDPKDHDAGFWSIDLEDFDHAEQQYERNTAVLITRLYDRKGQALEITDFMPRYKHRGRIYHPVMLMRRLRPLHGKPRVQVRLRPLCNHGAQLPGTTTGSNHIRFLLGEQTLRLTSDLPVPFLKRELGFVLDRDFSFVLGPDETPDDATGALLEDHLTRTLDYWHQWTRYLSVPFEWQEAVIRAAITLKLCQFESTGAIIAAPTTSIPESADSGRNWDYRYCWLRDAAFVVRALNRLGATRSMEEYLGYMLNLVSTSGELNPVYGITFEDQLKESEAAALGGYRGMGPVRIGNAAWQQQQYDVYGSLILAGEQIFFDQRLRRVGDRAIFEKLEQLGEIALHQAEQPDAGLWEYRGRKSAHTYTAALAGLEVGPGFDGFADACGRQRCRVWRRERGQGQEHRFSAQRQIPLSPLFRCRRRGFNRRSVRRFARDITKI